MSVQLVLTPSHYLTLCRGSLRLLVGLFVVQATRYASHVSTFLLVHSLERMGTQSLSCDLEDLGHVALGQDRTCSQVDVRHLHAN